MNTLRHQLGFWAFVAFVLAYVGILSGAMFWFQFGVGELPCPLCILQRYAFAAIALIALATVALPAAATRIGAALACTASLTGAGIAIRHLWVKAHPTVSCGIDPLETSLNKILTAQWFPTLFQADGLCTTEYDPILGLSIPQWALVWFTLFALITAIIALAKRRAA